MGLDECRWPQGSGIFAVHPVLSAGAGAPQESAAQSCFHSQLLLSTYAPSPAQGVTDTETLLHASCPCARPSLQDDSAFTR